MACRVVGDTWMAVFFCDTGCYMFRVEFREFCLPPANDKRLDKDHAHTRYSGGGSAAKVFDLG
eukprot:1327232-Amorphochlora_amoeboformis.AAC.1